MAQTLKKPEEMGFFPLTKISESRIVNGGRVLQTRMNNGFGAHRLGPEETQNSSACRGRAQIASCKAAPGNRVEAHLRDSDAANDT
jgi:hypothetical protein